MGQYGLDLAKTLDANCSKFGFRNASTATLIKLPYLDPLFAATSIKARVSVNVLFANYIEVSQVKM